MTSSWSSLAVWPGFARAKKDHGQFMERVSWTNDKWLRGTSGGKFVDGATPDFKATKESTASDAALAAKQWLGHPAYKMTLASTQKSVDLDNDGLIDRQEFRALMEASGYRGARADELFQKIDDGDGKLTRAELKKLSQGSSTLQSKG